ncbi:pentapeptide repeat-containing protein [Streptomyces sp. NPDC058642]|uniref:pentapeptide repeat-containing protein n=1 Tax=Streptomyces sp. NPDC058642 TaxID=3346572 RepID=UPI00364A5318
MKAGLSSPRVLGALAAVGVLIALGVIVWLPQMIYPPLTSRELSQLPSADKRVDLQQAQARVQNEFRSQLLQAMGGVVVVTGAVAGWRQLQLNREGQITERFSRAIDHMGSDTLDVRLGGIYALERVARNSPDDRQAISDILCAFIREHARWQVGVPDGPEHPTPTVDVQMPWLTTRSPDVQTALYVLGRRSAHPREHTLYLSRADLRRAELSQAQLATVNLRHTNLSRAYMPDSNLEHGDLTNADLRHANLRRACLAHANLCDAHLQHAYLDHAVLRGADLRGANLAGAVLDGTDFTDARTDHTTTWPDTGRPH